MLPLIVHIVFHPDSTDSRKLAEKIHRALNDDPAIPGMRIPTRFANEDGTKLPPLDGKYLQSKETKELIVVLADNRLQVGYEGNVPPGRKNWGQWIAELYEEAEKSTSFRCVPFQLEEHAWPLHERLEGVNFPRAWRIDEDKRDDWVINRLVLELVRFLHGEQAADEEHPQAPLKVFVSHTKIDLREEPGVVNSITRYLAQDKPVDAWYDSGDIDAGSRFAQKIEEGIKNSALLSVLTDSYSSREWCREEVFLAKELQRPVVVLDALQSLEIRSFPYAGNVPVIRWNGDPESALNLLFKEALRQLHIKLILDQHKKGNDIVLTTSPELLTVIGKHKKTFLYPDPPLGEEEMKRLSKSKVTVETPIQRFAKARRLNGKKIVLSLSESDDIRKYGLGLVHLNQMAIEISRYLLLAGAELCYAGHLGSEGYTMALLELVKSHPIPDAPCLHRIQSYIGWPAPQLNIDKKAAMKGLAEFKGIPRPDDITEKDDPLFVQDIKEPFEPDSGMKRFAWARGMTEMRQKLSKEKAINARIAMGGKIGPTLTAQPDGDRKKKWYNSRIPGVLEEILCSIENEQPVYLVGGFGGCAKLASDLLQGKERSEMSWDYHKEAPHAPKMRELYESREGVNWWGYPEMTQFLKDRGINGLNNKLDEDENRTLFEESDVSEIVRLLMKGLTEL